MRSSLLTIFSWIRPFTFLRWSIYLMAAVVIWLIFDYSLLQDYFHTRERRNRYREQLAQVEKLQTRLRLEREALKQGGFPAEKAIRERQHMAKPGEKILIIETPTTTTTTQSQLEMK